MTKKELDQRKKDVIFTPGDIDKLFEKSMLFGLAHATITSDAATYDPERLTSAIFLAQDFVEAIQEKIQKLSGLALKDNKQHSEMIKHLTEELSRSSCCGKS